MAYGWWRLAQGEQEKLCVYMDLSKCPTRAIHRELDREEAWMRIYLLPFLLAEEDRDIYRREMAQVAREREIMKDVEGWNVRCFPALVLCAIERHTGKETSLQH